ncbi:hypothetical protein M407DRAFT_242958 [Tulasnella calospora MUT 4182]|uniref:Secreted protein n=1 Tax=Tulasnella calospora MUT 4182 TaxID=1051891 RepID=A0A0C3QCW1_9AGAM|nr:hypothetical protein M407DRAFT_242958 [Tulasnella calospora MUT 4182]
MTVGAAVVTMAAAAVAGAATATTTTTTTLVREPVTLVKVTTPCGSKGALGVPRRSSKPAYRACRLSMDSIPTLSVGLNWVTESVKTHKRDSKGLMKTSQSILNGSAGVLRSV